MNKKSIIKKSIKKDGKGGFFSDLVNKVKGSFSDSARLDKSTDDYMSRSGISSRSGDYGAQYSAARSKIKAGTMPNWAKPQSSEIDKAVRLTGKGPKTIPALGRITKPY